MKSTLRGTLSLVAGAVLALASAPAALADSSQSTNWSGYAVHHSGVNFAKVVATWTQPTGACTPSASGTTYSSIWVGIGGYSPTSAALEQVGTDLDCSAAGQAVSDAWYELVPAASQMTKLTINPGDRVRASVTISGRTVRLTLSDLTRHRSFTKVLHASVLDTSSAEWIVEAPSICQGNNNCTTLPLADFGSASFSAASATTTTGHTGTISDRRWTATRINLVEGPNRQVGTGSKGTGAAPSSLTPGGTGFSVTYTGSGSPSGGSSDQPHTPTAGRIVHLGF